MCPVIIKSTFSPKSLFLQYYSSNEKERELTFPLDLDRMNLKFLYTLYFPAILNHLF